MGFPSCFIKIIFACSHLPIIVLRLRQVVRIAAIVAAGDGHGGGDAGLPGVGRQQVILPPPHDVVAARLEVLEQVRLPSW